MEHVGDAVAGLAGGMAQVCVGHPFDTVKVRMQAAGAPYARGVLSCLRETARAEGLRALYNGVGPPLVGAGACTALLFSVHGQARAFVRDHTPLLSPALHALLAGAATGVIMAPVLCPFELVKIRLQVSGTAGSPSYSGVRDCFAQSMRTARGYSLRPLFRGLSATLLRDVPSFAAYFGAYEALRPSDASPARLVLAGGLAGVAAWLPAYPQDVVKSVMQGGRPSAAGASFAATFAHVARARGLFRGFAPMVARAFPANAATFLAYEAVRALFPPYCSSPPDTL